MSLRDIFRSLHLIVRASHHARFPLGLIFPLNPSLSICPPEHRIYLKFPPASKAQPVSAPAAGLSASRPCSASLLCPQPQELWQPGQQPWLHIRWILCEPFGRPPKGKVSVFACKRKVAAANPQISLSLKPCSCAASQSRRTTLSDVIDSIPGLVLLCFSVSSLLFNPLNRLWGQSQAWRKQLQQFTSNIVQVHRDWLNQAADAEISGTSEMTQKKTSHSTYPFQNTHYQYP